MTPVDEDPDTEHGEEHADDDHRVVRSTASPADRRNEIGIVLIEAALHLVKEPLLLLR